MKKILLIVFAMLSLNTFAMVPKTPLKTANTESLKPVKFKAQGSFKDFVGSKAVIPAVKAPAKAPAEGTTSKFYMDCIEAITGIQYFCNLNHIYSEITTPPTTRHTFQTYSIQPYWATTFI
ncbi:unknown [Prevotella sp. CAG:1185]|nr:unknown [Prevotella sp. CAG:1185]